MQAVRAAARRTLQVRGFAAQAQMSVPVAQMMSKSKHDFVHFTNVAVKDRSSAEAKELYKYLNKCFTDNDTDYDGLVSYRGFNAMVAEAALAPRRFGFAPHTREMFKSKEAYDLARTELFNELKCSKTGRVTLEKWMAWANAHIKEKVGSGLAEHDLSKWERSKEDCIRFHKDVLKQKSTHNMKSQTSTQFKEFYMMQNDMFMKANKSHNGLLSREEFSELVKMANAIPLKFGMDWYSSAKFSDVAVNDKVGWKQWKEYSLKICKEGASKI